MGSAFDLKGVDELIKNKKFEDLKGIALECGFIWQGPKDKVHFGYYDYQKLGYKSKEEMVNYNDQIFSQLKNSVLHVKY